VQKSSYIKRDFGADIDRNDAYKRFLPSDPLPKSDQLPKISLGKTDGADRLAQCLCSSAYGDTVLTTAH
jgi:hypothetical protein